MKSLHDKAATSARDSRSKIKPQAVTGPLSFDTN